MTRALLALALAALLAGCGKYGPPVRAGTAVSGVTAGHPAGCQDPAHHHGADGSADAEAEAGATPEDVP